MPRADHRFGSFYQDAGRALECVVKEGRMKGGFSNWGDEIQIPWPVHSIPTDRHWFRLSLFPSPFQESEAGSAFRAPPLRPLSARFFNTPAMQGSDETSGALVGDWSAPGLMLGFPSPTSTSWPNHTYSQQIRPQLSKDVPSAAIRTKTVSPNSGTFLESPPSVMQHHHPRPLS